MTTISTTPVGTDENGHLRSSTRRDTLRTWLGDQRRYWLDYLILAVVFVVSYVAVLRTYSQFLPDSRYYLGMSLWFGGDSQAQAHSIVQSVARLHGYVTPSVQQMFGWGLVQPRVVFPLLAAPFVHVFGSTGLLMVTAAATVALVLVVYFLLARRYGRAISVGVVVLMMASPLIMYFSTAMLTESFSALWGAISLAVAWRYQRDPRMRWLLVLGAVTAVSAFTRQATFIVAGAFVVAWLLSLVIRSAPRGWGRPALVVGATAVILQIVQTIVFPSFSQTAHFETITGTKSLGAAILTTPHLLISILRADLDTYFQEDLVVLIVIVLALISLVVFWKRSESHLLLGALIGIALYNVTNGTPTAFRYSMPGLIFFLISVAVLASRVGRPRVARASLSVDETPSSASQ